MRGFAISLVVKVKICWINNFYWRCLKFFEALVVSYWFTWFLFVHCSISKELFKLSKRKFKGGEYVLLVHRNLLQCSWDHFKILLEIFKCDFEEICICIISPISFKLIRKDKGNKTTAYKRLTLNVQKPVDVPIYWRFFVKIFEFYLVTQPL